MAVPTGAERVYYNIFKSGEPEINVNFDVRVRVNSEETDAAAEAGANAVLSHLQATFPGDPIVASRFYEAHVNGDPWPAP